jgi:hypothetical protein
MNDGDLREVGRMFSDEDYRAIEAIAKVRKRMTLFFDRKKLLEEMLGIIERSECIVFSSDRSRKFIDPARPIFKLRLVMDVAMRIHAPAFMYSPSERTTEKEIADFRMNVIHREVVAPFSEVMRSALKSVDAELLREIPDAIDIAKFIVSSIFQVKTEIGSFADQSPICYIEYVL